MQRGPKCMRYEIFWERDPALKEVIDSAWKNSGHMADLGSINRALCTVMKKLQSWGSRKFGNISRELARLRELLANQHASGASREAIRATTDRMNEVLYREEMLWLQRSRIDWLREGDRNTKIFHHKAMWRARKNKISKLRIDLGVIKTDPTDMQRMTLSYFKSLYTRDPSLNHTSITVLIQEQIIEEMNCSCVEIFPMKKSRMPCFKLVPLKPQDPMAFQLASINGIGN